MLRIKYNFRCWALKFFGLDRMDVKHILQSSNNNQQATSNSFNSNLNDDSLLEKENQQIIFNQDLLHNLNDNCTWLGVQNFGVSVIRSFSPNFERVFGEETFLLKNGFNSFRGVKCVSGKKVLVSCKVVASGPLPIFICNAEDSTDNITTSVSKILQSIGAVTKEIGLGMKSSDFTVLMF